MTSNKPLAETHLTLWYSLTDFEKRTLQKIDDIPELEYKIQASTIDIVEHERIVEEIAFMSAEVRERKTLRRVKKAINKAFKDIAAEGSLHKSPIEALIDLEKELFGEEKGGQQ